MRDCPRDTRYRTIPVSRKEKRALTEKAGIKKYRRERMMRRAVTVGRIWSILALMTITAAGFLSLRARPAPHPVSFTPISTAGTLQPPKDPLATVASTSALYQRPEAAPAAARARLVRS